MMNDDDNKSARHSRNLLSNSEARWSEAKEEDLPPCVLFFTSGTSSSEEDMRFTGPATTCEREVNAKGTDEM